MALYASSDQINRSSGIRGQVPIFSVSAYDTCFSTPTSGCIQSIWSNPFLSGSPIRTQIVPQPYENYRAGVPMGAPSGPYSVRFESYFHAIASGLYDWRITADGGVRLWFDNILDSDSPYIDRWRYPVVLLDDPFPYPNGQTWPTNTYFSGRFGSLQTSLSSLSVTAGEIKIDPISTSAGTFGHMWLSTKNSYSAKNKLTVKARLRVSRADVSSANEVAGRLSLTDGVSPSNSPDSYNGIIVENSRNDVGGGAVVDWQVKIRTPLDNGYNTVSTLSDTDLTKDVEVGVNDDGIVEVFLDGTLVYSSSDSGLRISNYYISLSGSNSTTSSAPMFFDSLKIIADNRSTEITTIPPSGISFLSDTWHKIRVDYTPSPQKGRIGIYYKEPASSQDFGIEKPLTVGVLSVSPSEIQPRTVTNISTINESFVSNGVSEISFSVPATTHPTGLYTFDDDTLEWGILKKNRLITYKAGYQTASPPLDIDRLPQWIGFIDDVNLSRQRNQDMLTVKCRSLLKRAVEQINLNYPDDLSYDTINLFDFNDFEGPDGFNRPNAYDGWLITDAVRDMLLRAGIDTKYLYARDADGNLLIEDTGSRLDKQGNYSRAGFDNDEYLYRSEFGDKIYDMAVNILDGWGYEFRDHPSGIVLRTTDNPTISDSQKANLNDWNRGSFISTSGVTLINRAALFSDNFDTNPLDTIKWTPSTSGTNNGNLNNSLSVRTNAGKLELNLGTTADFIYEHPYVVTKTNYSFASEQHITFDYNIQSPVSPYNNYLYLLFRPSGVTDYPPQNGPDYFAYRIYKSSSSPNMQRHDLVLKATNMEVPSVVINDPISSTSPSIPDGGSLVSSGEWVLDVINKSTTYVNDTFGGSLSADLQQLTTYLYGGSGSAGSINFANDNLNMSINNAVVGVGTVNTIDFSSLKILMFRIKSNTINRSSLGVYGSAILRMEFTSDTSTNTLSGINGSSHFYIDFMYRASSIGHDDIRLNDINVAGGTSIIPLSTFLDSNDANIYITMKLDSPNATKSAIINMYINGTQILNNQIIGIPNNLSDTLRFKMLGMSTTTIRPGFLNGTTNLFPITDLLICDPATFTVNSSIFYVGSNNSMIPFYTFSPNTSPAPLLFDNAYIYLYTSGIPDIALTNKIDNFNIDTLNGPFISGLSITSRSLNSGINYDSWLISDGSFDFTHNLRKAFSTYAYDGVLPGSVISGDETIKSYFQLSSSYDSSLPQRMQDEYIRMESDINQSGILWKAIDYSISNSQNIFLKENFESISPFLWGDFSTISSGLVSTNSNGLIIKPQSNIQRTPINRGIRTHSAIPTTKGIYIDSIINVGALDVNSQFNEAFMLFSNYEAPIPSGVGTATIDPIQQTTEGFAFIISQWKRPNNNHARRLTFLNIHNGVHSSGLGGTVIPDPIGAYYEESDINSNNDGINLGNRVTIYSKYLSGSNDTELYFKLNNEVSAATLNSNISIPSGWLYYGYRTTFNVSDLPAQTEPSLGIQALTIANPYRELATIGRSSSLPLNDTPSIDIGPDRIRCKLASQSIAFYEGQRFSNFTEGFASFGGETSDPNNYTASFNKLKFVDDGGSSILTFDPRWQKHISLRAFRGEYLETQTSGVFLEFDFEGQVLKFIMGRSSDSGSINVDIDGTNILSNYSLSYPREWFYFNGIDPNVGTNPSIINIASNLAQGSHTCKISSVLAANEIIRFDAAESFRVNRDAAVYTLATDQNISRLEANIGDRDIRNDIIIVGKRLGTVEDDPNNKKFDYIISRSVDADSISNPTGINYVGENKPTIVFNPNIITQERADYASFVLLQRHRKASILATEEGPAIPHLEPMDVVGIHDARHGVTDSKLYTIEAIRGDMSRTKYVRSFDLSPFKPFPSFQRLQQPNIDDFNNEPLINIRIDVLDDFGNPTNVSNYTEESPFDPYLCDSDKGAYRIRFLWDQVIDGTVYINVYNDINGAISDSIRGGTVAFGPDAEAIENGRLFNEFVEAGIDRKELWDCTNNAGFYSYAGSRWSFEEIPANIDNPIGHQLTFEFVHIDRNGVQRIIRSHDTTIQNSVFPQRLWVRLQQPQISVNDFQVIGGLTVQSQVMSTINGGLSPSNSYINVDNVVEEATRVIDGRSYSRSVAVSFKTGVNLVSNADDALKVEVKKTRSYIGRFVGWASSLMPTPNILTINGNLKGGGWWILGLPSSPHYLVKDYDYTNDFVDAHSSIINIEGDFRYPGTRYTSVIQPMSFDGSSETLFNTDTGDNGRIGGNYWPSFYFRAGYPLLSTPLYNGVADRYIHNGSVTFRYDRDLFIEEKIIYKITAMDNAGPWRKKVLETTLYLNNSNNKYKISANNVQVRLAQWHHTSYRNAILHSITAAVANNTSWASDTVDTNARGNVYQTSTSADGSINGYIITSTGVTRRIYRRSHPMDLLIKTDEINSMSLNHIAFYHRTDNQVLSEGRIIQSIR